MLAASSKVLPPATVLSSACAIRTTGVARRDLQHPHRHPVGISDSVLNLGTALEGCRFHFRCFLTMPICRERRQRRRRVHSVIALPVMRGRIECVALGRISLLESRVAAWRPWRAVNHMNLMLSQHEALGLTEMDEGAWTRGGWRNVCRGRR
jgi:hypothetical protein